MEQQPEETTRTPGTIFGALRTMPVLHKCILGAATALLCTGLGFGVAAGFSQQPHVVLPTPSPTPVITQAPTPSPSPTPAPVELFADVTVVQQEIGVTLYTLPHPEDGEEADKLPLTGVEVTLTLTDGDGVVTDLPLDTATGSALAEDLTPGDYTVTVPELEGYLVPEPQTVTVKEKVVYKVDVAAVQEKIVQADQVVESQEDSSYGTPTVVVEELVDTVAFAEPAKVETGTTTVYTGKTSNRGYLLLSSGAETPYKPVYNDSRQLTGAVRDKAFQAASSRGADAGIVYLGKALPSALRWVTTDPTVTPVTTDASPAPTAAPTEAPTAEPSPEPTAEPTGEPTAEPTQEPSAAPTESPAPSPSQTPDATPEPANTPEPSHTPTPAPTADPYATWPDSIEAAKLANYGFAVTASTVVNYQYTGWQTIDGKSYYYDPATHQPVTGQQVINGDIYNFAADGALNQTARGIDVSKFQGVIDWNAVASDGITFAIIRCGYRGYGSGALVEDSTFRANIKGAIAAGLKVGVYFYSQAVTEEEAVEEASMVISLCRGYALPCGVYYDTEKVAGDTGRADGISAAQRTACAVAFCEAIRNAGYSAGVYSYASWFYNQLNFANISKYRIWIAQYRDTLSFNYNYNIWQYTGSGRVKGISTAVDMNLG